MQIRSSYPAQSFKRQARGLITLTYFLYGKAKFVRLAGIITHAVIGCTHSLPARPRGGSSLVDSRRGSRGAAGSAS